MYKKILEMINGIVGRIKGMSIKKGVKTSARASFWFIHDREI